jgi:shikimate dehydrogenase
MSALFGLVGRTLSHSWSPQIHTAIMQRLGVEGRYELYPMEPEALGGFIESVGSAGGPCGVNVTIPYKQAVAGFLDSVSDEAAAIGAVNTVAFSGGRLAGYNTDYYGFRASLARQGAEVSGKPALILGSGGSAKTAAKVLRDMGASEIYIASRSPEIARQTFAAEEVIGYDATDSLEGLGLLVNTTPAGMHGSPNSMPIPGNAVPRAGYVFDFIYNPMDTPLLKIAREQGSETQNGLYMLAAQAAAAQGIWQGVDIPAALIEDVYNEIGERMGNA